MEDYERKRQEERKKVFERIHTQNLIRDFPNLKAGGLLLDPEVEKERPSGYVTKERTVIVAPREIELQHEWESSQQRFPEGPDERGWVRHTCCGTICAIRRIPPQKPEPKEWCGESRH